MIPRRTAGWAGWARGERAPRREGGHRSTGHVIAHQRGEHGAVRERTKRTVVGAQGDRFFFFFFLNRGEQLIKIAATTNIHRRV